MTNHYRKVEEAGRHALLTRFVSLGENCELGFVQEHLGVHPLDLFRWSGITADHLITALETRFDGIGESENTAIRLNPHDLEFYIDDRRYGMVTHTRMSSRQHSEEYTYQVFCKRALRLREKLIDDISDAEKIFVYQSREPLTEKKLLRLHAALRELGPQTELLYIHPARARERPGTLRRVRPGLLEGVIDKAGLNGGPWSISYKVWLDLMAKAVKLTGGKPPRGSFASVKHLGLPKTF